MKPITRFHSSRSFLSSSTVIVPLEFAMAKIKVPNRKTNIIFSSFRPEDQEL